MKNIINIIEILGDLEEIRKKVYLDSPEVFVDLVDKIESNQFDEMVLFFATKYDYLSIVDYIVRNKMIDLNAPSKNNQFPNIKEHLLKAAIEFGAKDIYDYLLNYNTQKTEDYTTDIENFIKTVGETLSDLYNQVDTEDNYNPQEESKEVDTEAVDNAENTTETEIKTEAESQDEIDTEEKAEPKNLKNEDNCDVASSYEPKFICPNCNCNIFETGYSTSEKITYQYSKEAKGIKAVSKEQENSVTCSECGYVIEQLNPVFLENLCTVQNCKKCGKDLTSTGIITKMKTEYDSDSNSFITSKKSYHCAECDNELTDYQVNYFKL